MASVNSGELLFPIFMAVDRTPRTPKETEEVKDLIQDTFATYSSELEEIDWTSENRVTINFRLLDWDDFDQEEFESLMDELEEELKQWEKSNV